MLRFVALALVLGLCSITACAVSSPPGRYCRVDKSSVCWEVNFVTKKAWIVFPSGKRAPGSMALHETKTEGASFAATAPDEGEILFKPLSASSMIIKHSGGTSDDLWVFSAPLSSEP